MPGDVTWQQDGDRATLVCGSLRATVDVRHPTQGLHDLLLDEQPLAVGRLLGVALDASAPDSVADFYRRGGDLIVRYVQTDDRPFAVVVYWRAGLTGAAGYPYVDLVASVETSLLDSRPEIEALTSLPLSAEEVRQSSPHCRLAPLAGRNTSYLEMQHPDDGLSGSLIAMNGGVTLATRLFGLPLEKGVILRSRLRGMFVPQHEEEGLVDAFAQFAAAAPPLTT